MAPDSFLCAHLQEIADIDAKFRLKMAGSNGRLEDAMESVALHEHKRRPQRRSVYEVLLKACLSETFLNVSPFRAYLILTGRAHQSDIGRRATCGLSAVLVWY